MILEAFAKINWSLDITGLREDGYHLMDMLMQPVSLPDEIILRPADILTITTGGVPSRADGSNLAFRAALMLKEETGFSGGVTIHLHKRIPTGAGMGGGSSDAAAVLVGLNRLWNTGLCPEELERIGLKLGADVPFFIRGGLTRTRGIGEILESHEYMYNYWLIIVQPCAGLSTAKVFSLWEDSADLVHPQTNSGLEALKAGNLAMLCGSISNVLQPCAEKLRPEISGACESLKRAGAVNAVMTGSGSAVFGVFRSSSAAEKARRSILTQYREQSVFLCHTQNDSMRIIEE